MPDVSVNGIRLYYEEEGEGPPLLLVHGFMNTGFSWAPLREPLSSRFRLLIPDLRGHGNSDKPAGPYSIELFVDDLLRFLDALKIDRVDFMGHSMGGRIGTYFGVEHSDRLRRLFLVASSAGPPSEESRTRHEELFQAAREKGMEAVFEHPRMQNNFLPTYLKTGPLSAEYRRLYLANPPEIFCAVGEGMLKMADLRGRMGEIRVPTWVCCGSNDNGPMTYARDYETKVPNCTLTIFEGLRHYAFYEDTPLFLERMDEFLAKNP